MTAAQDFLIAPSILSANFARLGEEVHRPGRQRVQGGAGPGRGQRRDHEAGELVKAHDLADYPTCKRIYDTCMAMDVFSETHPRKQPDFPADH